MIPAAEGQRWTLYCGDALAVLRDLPTGSVDAIITDPPYSSGGMMRGDRANVDTKSKYTGAYGKQPDLPQFSGDNRDQRGYGYWCALWMGEALRVVRPGGVLLTFTDWRQLPTTTDVVQAGGWVWRGIVPWYKPQVRPMSGRFMPSCEYIVWASNGAMPVDYGNPAPSLPGFYQAMAPRDRQHITQKPLEVMRGLVRIAPPGGVVLDPFLGSGTTGVAAMLEGRAFIGAELAAAHFETAAERIRTAAQGYRADGQQLVIGVESEAV